jgi:hypothetical protein
MNGSAIVVTLTLLIALLAAVAAGAGLFARAGGAPYDFITLREQTTRIYNRGLYRYDTLFFGAGFKGQDAVVLFLGVPLLLATLLFYRQGSLAAHLLLVGLVGYFLYVYASMALGAAYNPFFLVYIALFSASLFAFILLVATVDRAALAAYVARGAPRRSLATFMIVAGVVTIFVWGAPLVTALLRGTAPERMDSYTTMVTYALDLAIITPATFLCAALVLRADPLGYVIAAPLLAIIILLAPQIALSTIFQRNAGIPFTTGEMVGPVAGFVVLGLIAVWLLVATLRAVTPAP